MDAAAPKEGDAVTFSAVVQNIGNGPTPGADPKVSFRINGQEVAVSSSYSIAIAAGGSATFAAATSWTSSHGAYPVTAVVNPSDSMSEFDFSNNSLTKTITLTQIPGPDLIVQSIAWTPSNPAAGTAVSFKATVKNQGNTAATGPIAVSLAVNGGAALSGSLSGLLDTGASAIVNINGAWTAANGRATLVATVDPQNTITESFEGNNTLAQSFVVGRGAVVPWIEYQAEDGMLGGGATVVGPSRVYGTPAGEASGRKAVMLSQTGASVSWVAIASANSIVIRNCIPDATTGGGLDAPIGLYINGQHKADITLSSKHSWVYGKDNDPQTDDPANGQPRKIYDESHLLFSGFSINAGDTVMLRKDAIDNVAYNSIDFVDLEQVGPPIPMPAGYISITDSSQTWKPASLSDSTSFDNAFYMCLTTAQSGKYAGVYVPPGTWIQKQKQQPNNVKIQGAGMWYTMIYCPDQSEGDWGTTGFIISGDNCEFRDFALFGWGGRRTQGGKAFCNNTHKNMVVQRLWIEHVTCAAWVGGGGESTNSQFLDCRIRNTGADGINLCNGSLNCLIQNCTARNTGDDAFAVWSATDAYAHPCTNNIIRNCTAELPWRAACFAIYGGDGNRIENCVAIDAITYPGLTMSSEFTPYPMDSATVDGLTVTRCGAHYFIGYPYEGYFGAVWLRADMTPTNGITIKNVDIIDPTYSGILFQGTGTFTNILLQNMTVANPTTSCIAVNSGTTGSATLKNVQFVSNQYSVPRVVNNSTTFTLIEENDPVRLQMPAAAKPQATIRGGLRPVISLLLPQRPGASGYHVTVAVYLINGKKAAVLADKEYEPGAYNLTIDRTRSTESSRAAGMYLAAVTINGDKQIFKVMLK